MSDHESPFNRNERYITSLEEQLEKLKFVVMRKIKQTSIFAELLRAIALSKILNDPICSAEKGLYMLIYIKLDPSLISYKSASWLIENVIRILVKRAKVWQ